ncbi:MAG: 2-oxo acid dehydrogenase subunit E2 [Clostridia bacterium]|nr:2-oxo acid dehydrogenase subunit E2 [Clostridia bacterium]MBQ9945205.1 2-oxo acid dehydrogenase subunit E2 [Clostridia bacterium]
MARQFTSHFGIQRKMVAAMTTQSWREIPHVTYMYEPDAEALCSFYAEEVKPLGISFNTLMIKVLTEGLKAAIKMNSVLDYDRHYVKGKLTTHEKISISMPMILPNDEMMTVNLHGFHKKSMTQMTEYIEDIRRRAEKTNLTEAMYDISFNKTIGELKKGKIDVAARRILGAKLGKHKVRTLKGKEKEEYESIPDTERLTKYDFEPGTITISNIGSLYPQQKGACTLLEIVPPQVTAIAVGSAQDKAVVITKEDESKEIAIRKVIPLCIAFDHRALDFGDIVPFLKRMDDIFENPAQIKDWI